MEIASQADLLDALDDLRWSDKPLEASILENVLTTWSEFSKVVSWVSFQLSAITETDEIVNAVMKQEDVGIFQMELSSFLKELGCPYQELTEGELSKRYLNKQQKVLVLNFLLSELQAARMVYTNRTSKTQLTVELSESPQAKLLRQMLQTLDCSKPPDTITASALCSKIEERIFNRKPSKNLVEDAIFNGLLSPQQWNTLEDLNNQLHSEYQMRREMLLKRLDVTIQSFNWSDRLRCKKEDVDKLYSKHRQQLDLHSNVSVSDVLASRVDLALIEKSSCTSVRKNTRSAINNVKIGRVPDRGGRPDEVQPPPPEMPPWQQRQNAGSGASGSSGWIQNSNTQRGGRGGPRGGGGRVQGGWSDSNQSRGNCSNSGGHEQQRQQYTNQYSGRQDASQVGYQQGNYNQYGNQGQYDANPQYNRNQGNSNNQYGSQDNYNSRPPRGHDRRRGGEDYSRGGSRGSNRY